ncbi:hypothetical protein CFC21_096273 [Triticum aestivum]|uniref:Secreted protein n=3 Tax=Triticum TaxID=4564 RepID=A0A9R0Z3X0_TRITD|nr:hypothetical protein CFC21_096273 [Triticum aestivum]VAI70762.1 unnamed protein product [Triticum turgidum subsp. durum]
MAPHPIRLRTARLAGRHIALWAVLKWASGEPGTTGPSKGTMSQRRSGYPFPSATRNGIIPPSFARPVALRSPPSSHLTTWRVGKVATGLHRAREPIGTGRDLSKLH